MSEPRCKHNWVMPPECPQCVSDERDELKEKLKLAREALDEASSAFQQFTSAERRIGGIGGQTVGHERYRLEYSGFHRAPVFDAFLKAHAALASDGKGANE